MLPRPLRSTPLIGTLQEAAFEILIARALSWLAVLGILAWAIRYAFLEGLWYPRQRGFAGDFTIVSTSPAHWDGISMYYGPLFVLEHLGFVRSRWISLDALAYLNILIFAVAIAVCLIAVAKGVDRRVTVGVIAVLIGHRATAWSLSTNAHLEFVELMFISIALLLAVRGKLAVSGVSLGLAAATKTMPGVFLVFLALGQRWLMLLSALVAGGFAYVAAVAALRVSPIDGFLALVFQNGQLAMSGGGIYLQSWRAAITRMLYGPDNVSSEQATVAFAIHLIFAAVVVGVSAVVLTRTKPWNYGLAFGLISVVMLLVTPQAHISFHILLYPAFIAAAMTLAHRPRSITTSACWAALVLAVALNGFPQAGRIARPLGVELESNWDALNFPPYGELILFAVVLSLIVTSGHFRLGGLAARPDRELPSSMKERAVVKSSFASARQRPSEESAP